MLNGLFDPRFFRAHASQGDGPETAPDGLARVAASTHEPPAVPVRAYQRPGEDPKRDDIVYEYPDGSVELRTGGTLAWRANNPGNVQYGKFAQKQGAIGQFSNGVAIFPGTEHGNKAMETLLSGPSYRGLTVDQVVARYSGADAKILPNYQVYVRARILEPNDGPHDALDAERRRQMYQAIRGFEKNVEGRTIRSTGE